MGCQFLLQALRTDPALRFSVTAVGFYGMSTFEGPVMSIRDVNALAHYTDWVVGHVHSGALGWVAFISFGALYYLVPVLWNRSGVWSTRMIAWHYWIATLGIVFFSAPPRRRLRQSHALERLPSRDRNQLIKRLFAENLIDALAVPAYRRRDQHGVRRRVQLEMLLRMG